jgi:translation elongation factor EF-Tu-like GTPase
MKDKAYEIVELMTNLDYCHKHIPLLEDDSELTEAYIKHFAQKIRDLCKEAMEHGYSETRNPDLPKDRPYRLYIDSMFEYWQQKQEE